MQTIQCTEVWGGTGACDVSVKLAGVRGECYSQPYRESVAGGDIHFLSVCGMSILSKIVVADVSGHGEKTAAASRIIHDALVENIGAHDNSTMLARVNEAFLARRAEGPLKFTTMASLIFDSRDRSLVYAYAGHPAILYGSCADGRFRTIRPEGPRGGLPLGVLPGTAYEQHCAELAAGDVLVIYSDAFIEAPAPGGGMLGERGFAKMLEEAGTFAPDELKDHVLDRVGRELEDDASLVVLEIL